MSGVSGMTSHGYRYLWAGMFTDLLAARASVSVNKQGAAAPMRASAPVGGGAYVTAWLPAGDNFNSYEHHYESGVTMADATTDNLTHRLTKVEASTIALEHSINNFIKASGDQVRSLSDNIQRVAEQSSRDRASLSNDLQNLALRQASGSKPNWAAVAVGISIFSLVMGFGAYAVSTVEARINVLRVCT